MESQPNNETLPSIQWSDFQKIDLRVGTVIQAEPFPEAKKPAYKLWVDLGTTLGIKKSSAQITRLYQPQELIGRQVLCVVNFPPRQIANFMSEILVTGLLQENGDVVLMHPGQPVPNGTRLA